MRLLWLTDDFLPHRGGSRIVYHNVCSGLGGGASCLVTRRIEGCDAFDRTAPYRIKRVHVPFLRIAAELRAAELALFLPFLLACTAEVMRWRPEMVHCGEPMTSGLVGYVVKKLFGIPYVIWLHDNPFGPPSRLRYPLKKFLCFHADGIVTTCNYARSAVVGEGYPAERAECIFPGVDTSVFRPSGAGERVRGRFGIAGRRVLLTISRLLPQKGQDVVIRALPLLLSEHPDLVYLVGGDGPHRAALEELARSVGVSDRVIFAGFVPQEEIADYYNACDLFIMLNREVGGLSWEGFGIVFLEASACGKPVIGGRAGGVADCVLDGVTGLLVSPEDVGEVAGSIDRLLRDGELARRMGGAGLERARSEFSWEDRARKTLAFSERIARKGVASTGKTRSTPGVHH